MREPNRPEGAEALHWIILSTGPITDAKGAREALGWHVQRWQIEVLRQTWKTGCKVEDRRGSGKDRTPWWLSGHLGYQQLGFQAHEAPRRAGA